MKPTANLQN